MLITDSDALADFISSLDGAPYVAVDTEFVREKTYYPLLCLVQVAYKDKVAAIDTLVDGLDLRPLGELLANPEVVKVFHAAPQDLEIFLHETGALPTPVFDTQIAAGVTGHGEQPGYAKLVESMLGIQVDKASQSTDWSRRPLTDRQLDYALSDVTHLCDVYEQLTAELAASGRSDWIAEDLAGLMDEARYRTDPDLAYKRIKVRRPKAKMLAVLRELGRWREEQAVRRDLPRRWVVKDEPLLEIAQQLPKDAKALERVRGLSAKMAHGRDGAALLACVTRALALPQDQWPEVPKKRPTKPINDSLVALLQALLRLRCDEHDVAMRLVATRKDLDAIVLGKPADEVAALHGWRAEVFGNDALALRDGKVALTGSGDDVVAIRLDGADV